MVVIRAYHATKHAYMSSIMATGLEPRKTCDYHYPYLTEQPEGIYVALNPNPASWWWSEARLELMYCGPVMPDPELYRTCWSGQAHVLLERVPAEWIRPLSLEDYQRALAEYVEPPVPAGVKEIERERAWF
jgi:hypothetical protein